MLKFISISAYLFFCVNAAAQKLPASAEADSLFFETAFSKYNSILKDLPLWALDTLEKIKAIAADRNYYPAINRYYLEKAAWFLSNKKNDSAINYYEAAIRSAKQNNKGEELGSAYLSLANFYQYNGNSIAAAENYLSATEVLKNVGKKRILIGLYRNFFTILGRLQQKNGILKNLLSTIDADKNDESDIDAGRLIVIVGLAFVKPAEFEQFSFRQTP